MIHALQANGPHASVREEATVFDWLVGTWDLTCDRYSEDGKHSYQEGVWRFGWILDGRMIQDVIDFYPPGHPADHVSGTTLRLYDAQIRKWRVTFFAPARNAIISLVGSRVGDRIVLVGTDTDGSPLRWSFTDIASGSFSWTGEISADGGKTWRIEQKMHLTRRRPQRAVRGSPRAGDDPS